MNNRARLCALLPLFLAAACARSASSALRPDQQAPPASAAPAPARIPVAEAAAIVREGIFSETPTMNPVSEFPLTEITTDDVWARLRVQVFQVTDGPRHDRTYVLRGGRAESIGAGFGGFGVRSICAADINGDDALDLVFSYSWGSGIHRSHVAYADLSGETLVEHVAPEACFSMEDLMVRCATSGDASVEVLLEGEVIGHLVAADAEPPVRLELGAGIDQDVLKRRR